MMKLNEPLQAWCMQYALEAYRKENDPKIPTDFSMVVEHARNVYNSIIKIWGFDHVNMQDKPSKKTIQEMLKEEEKEKIDYEKAKFNKALYGKIFPDVRMKVELLIKEEERHIAYLLDDIRKWEEEWSSIFPGTEPVADVIKRINKEYKVIKR